MEIQQINEINQINVQTLAFIGDAVYSLFFREKILKLNVHLKTNLINKKCNQNVNASAQSLFALSVFEELTEEEKNIFLRARNFKTKNSAKNSSIIEYHNATAIEAVIGYLYLCRNYERIEFLLNQAPIL